MSKPNLRRPSAGLVLGTLALIVAVAGNTGAFAGTKVTKVVIRKGQIAKGAVSAKALAPGAVHPAAISKGAVGLAALRPGSVDSSVLAPDSVTSGALAPGAVYGGVLGEVTLHAAALKDEDLSADLSNWTVSQPAIAMCASGERVLSGGVVVTNSGNHRVGIVQTAPFSNGGNTGWVGQITTDAGGQATAEVQALCLK
jgi:hypothetical protein